jgi:hypothetical protein
MAEAGAAEAGMADTTADVAIGIQVITDGTAVGAGSLAGTIHGGCFSRQSFQSRFLTLTTADMDTVQGTGMAEDTKQPLSCAVKLPDIGKFVFQP